jgi:hypothetical protein
MALVAKTIGNAMVLPKKFNLARIARQAIEVSAEMARKGLKPIERLRLIEDLGVQLQGKGG